MRNLLLGVAAATALLAANAAHATNVSVWVDHPSVASDTTFANVAGLGTPDATATVGAINFTTSCSDCISIDTFLGTSIGGAIGGHHVDNSVFEFTGSTYLNAGSNSFVVAHDDGLQLKMLGGLVVDKPGPTSEDFTPFNVNAPSAGIYSFDLVYGECCGGPADIVFEVNGAPAGVPEPATWAMMLMGVAGIGAVLRRNKQQHAAAVA